MEEQSNRVIPMHPWGAGGPKSPEHRKMAKDWFLEDLPRIHVVTLACEYAGIVPKTAYEWKKHDLKFSEAWDVAVERIHDTARSAIFRRAFEGIESYVVSNGKLVYGPDDFPLVEKKYSDSLAALYARSNLPEYKDKQQIDIKLQMAEQDARDKEELLAGLAAAIANEDKEPTS